MIPKKTHDKLQLIKPRNQGLVMSSNEKAAETLQKKELLLRSSTQVANVIANKSQFTAVAPQ